MKSLYFFVVFAFVFLFTSMPISLAQCVEGIDDICDPNCIAVDYDCVENQNAGVQDILCIVEPDGICQDGCHDSDWDCFLEQQPAIEEENIDALIEELSDTPVTTPTAAGNLTFVQQLLLVLGGLVLCVGIYLLFVRFQHRHQRSVYTDMLPYGQQALAQGYTKDQIKQSLEHRGYSKQYIDGYFKALEHKP